MKSPQVGIALAWGDVLTSGGHHRSRDFAFTAHPDGLAEAQAEVPGLYLT
jgi:hypothetical protein